MTTTYGANDPDAIRRDIEQTRSRLSQDVDTLTEKVSPGRVMHRRMDRMKSSVSSITDKVMGSSDGKHSRGVRDNASSTASDLQSTAADLPARARQQAQGSPLTAGLVAFGIGWLASALLPATDAEQRAAEATKEQAKQHADTVKQPLVEAAQGAKENLQGPAQEAAQSLKASAQEGMESVKQDAASAKEDMTGQMRESRHAVQEPADTSTLDVRESEARTTTY